MRQSERATPTLLLLIGPPAVGKMTVGQLLAARTGFRLFHHHQIIDLVTEYFPFSDRPDSPFERLVVAYRRMFFGEAARAGLQIVSTTGWRFDLAQDAEAIRDYTRPFRDRGGRVFVVELQASLATRLERNLTPNRHAHKKTDWSTEAVLRDDGNKHLYHSGGRLPLDLPHLCIDTEGTTAEHVAETIRAWLALM